MLYFNYLLKTPALLLFLLTLTSCGGGGANPNALTVTATTPAEGSTDILTNSALTFTFDKDIDTTTLTNATVTLAGSNTVSGALTYDATTRTATFTPDAELKPGTVHTAWLTTSVTDTAGNGLADVFQLQFTTEPFIRRVSVDSAGQEATSNSYYPALSADGRYVMLQSDATNLAPSGDTNGASDIFRVLFKTTP